MSSKNKMSIEDKIKQIISERLEIKKEEIKLESKLRDDLGIDSFGFVELIFEIKDKFGITIPDQDFTSILKVKDAVNYLYNKIKEG
jgi:acyl carrier protein